MADSPAGNRHSRNSQHARRESGLPSACALPSSAPSSNRLRPGSQEVQSEQAKLRAVSEKAVRPSEKRRGSVELLPADSRRSGGEAPTIRCHGLDTGDSTFRDLVADLVTCYDDQMGALRHKIIQLEELYAQQAEYGNNMSSEGSPCEVASAFMEKQNTEFDFAAAAESTRSEPLAAKHEVSQRSIKIGNIELEFDEHPKHGLQWFLKGPLDIIVSVVIVLNAATLFANFQFVGLRLGYEIDVLPFDPTWTGYPGFFFMLEHVFQVIYLVELVVRVGWQRQHFFFDEESCAPQKFNLFDFAVVLMGCFDLYLLPLVSPGNSENSTWAFARLIRIARLSRSLKIVRVLKVFSQLRVLVSTIGNSIFALFWSMVLLFILMIMGACCILQMVQSDLKDGVERGIMDDRLRNDLWIQFGTAFKALWSMFEMTLGGQGTSLARPLVELHWVYALFFFTYISVVVFAIICIIEALFLKDTLKMAANDADMMVQQQLEAKKLLSGRIHDFFVAADTSCDGMVSREEFENIMCIPKVKGFLEMMEIEAEEVKCLFALLDPGAGCVPYEDFLSGIMRLKGQARSMDVVTVMLDCKKVLNTCRGIERGLKEMRGEKLAGVAI